MLLENQEAWCIQENGPNYAPTNGNVAGAGGSIGTGQTTGRSAFGTPGTDEYAQGDFRLPKILIPMIRRTFPELITNEIVGVQPMAGPVGLAFALRYVIAILGKPLVLVSTAKQVLVTLLLVKAVSSRMQPAKRQVTTTCKLHTLVHPLLISLVQATLRIT
jgi:hypothetical protein